MAKGNRKAKGTNDWKPQPNDAINLATIRWFALAIESKGIELYGTNPAVFPKIQAALKQGLDAINAVSVKKPIGDEDDCPPGWVPCGPDCAPACGN